MRNLALYLLSANALFAASPASQGVEITLTPPRTFATFEVMGDEAPTLSASISSTETSSDDDDDDDASDGCEVESPSIPGPDEVPAWQTRSLDVPLLLHIDRDCFKNRGPPIA